MIQLLSALTNCEKSATKCGIMNNERVDVYISLYSMLDTGLRFERDPVKKAIMTNFYSSKKEPKEVFGDKVEEFYELMYKELPGPTIMNKMLERLWNKNALSHNWVMPDNFHVNIKVKENISESFIFDSEPYEIITKVNTCSENFRSLSANFTHSIDGFGVREIQRRCNFEPEKIEYVTSLFGSDKKSIFRQKDEMVLRLWKLYLETNILSARIFDYLDEYNFGHVKGEVIANLILKLPRKPFEVLTIHDAFKCHPNYGNCIRKQYNIFLSELSNSTLVTKMIRDITGNKDMVFDTGNKVLAENILQTNYALS